MFRTLNKDNTDTEVLICGARSKSSNQDAASLVFVNYDEDTQKYHRVGEMAVVDHFGNSYSNGMCDIMLRTCESGLSNDLSTRMIITYDGRVAVGNQGNRAHPEKLFVDGSIGIAASGTITKQGASYVPTVCTISSQPIVVKPLTINAWQRITSWNSPGKAASDIIAYCRSGAPYHLRVMDVDKREILGSASFSNLTSSNCQFPIIACTHDNYASSNLWELQAMTGTSIVNVDTVAVNYVL